MGWLVAKAYDRLMRGAERKHITAWRRLTLQPVAGDVLEIGAGTGANLDCYGDEVSRLVLCEPDRHMRKQLLAKVDSSATHIEVGDSFAEKLPYDDESFDWVVSTLVLCSVRNPEAVLKEILRVLRPSGKLAFVEHVLDGEDRKNRRRQKRWQPLWGVVAANCQVVRDTAATMRECGFDLGNLEHDRMRIGPRIVQPIIRGYAARI